MIRGAALGFLVAASLAPFAVAEPDAPSESPEGASERSLDREETAAERRRREAGRAVFDESGRIRDQSDQLSRRPGVTVDRLRRDQTPTYGVGPGVNIIRR